MLRFLIAAFFAAFVGLAAARAMQDQTIPIRAQSSPPTASCCLPKQWSAKISVLDTIGSDKINFLDSQTDYERKQQVMYSYTLGSLEPDSKVLIDFDNGLLYSVPSSAPTTCNKMALKLPLIQCIPDDAEYLGSSYMGPMGAGQMDYDAWRIRPTVNASNPTVNVVYTLAVSKNQCVPLVEGAHYPDGSIPDQHFMFLGFQPSLTDPSAFTLPRSCYN